MLDLKVFPTTQYLKTIPTLLYFHRSASLAHVNSMLREQLDQATAANQSLTADIHKLTQEWQRAREELDAKESEWREEEQVRVIISFFCIT